MKHFPHLIAVAILLTACGAKNENFTVYKNTEQKINLEYPAGWTVKEDTFGADNKAMAFLSPAQSEDDDFRENLVLMVQDLSKAPGNVTYNLEDYTELTLGQITTVMQGEIMEQGETTMAGLPAYQLTYTSAATGRSQQFWQVWALKGEVAYLFTYTALTETYDKYVPHAQTMFGTIKIK